MNNRLLDALKCENTGRPPLWLMRQAGRYMPQYRALKEKHQLIDMFHNVDLICHVTKLPLDLLPVDAAILFSDILSVLDGLGVDWGFDEGSGPVIAPVASPASLRRINPEEAYPHIDQAIRALKKELKIPLLGFVGAPFTIASYLIEGKTSRDFRKTKRWMFADPVSFHALLDKITDATIDYLKLQERAGVDAAQIFDSWAHTLSPSAFREFALPYIQKIVASTNLPVILFCKGSFLFTKDLAKLKPAAISFDWCGEIGAVRSQLPSNIAIQGNLDPALLYAPKQKIKEACQKLLNQMQGDKGYIFNLGHGLLPDTPVSHVQYLCDYVQSHA